MTGYFKDLVNQSLERTREATLSILGVNEGGLRAHLANRMHNTMGKDGCFLAPPVFEHTFGWETAPETFEQLGGELLSHEILSALASSDNSEYRFELSKNPYKHQLSCWHTLLADEPRSTVITTGTGSGKTECFMIPILEDLVREHLATNSALVGVRALFLYPLNALINSQRQRLDAWTKPFESNLRFCLYNGNTENSETSVRKEQASCPNQILSRERLRKEPAPILMTNATMLEYMLVRQIDEPILRISREQQSLRWIVLDEAHTYVGSRAAELSLLLRRVVEAFGRKAKDIRFITTSATLADDDSEEKLRSYLAALAGVPDEQVLVIPGSRCIPDIPPAESRTFAFDDIRSINPGTAVSPRRHELLSKSDVAQVIRSCIVNSPRPLDLNELLEATERLLNGNDKAEQQQELLDWIDLLTSTRPSEKEAPFLKLRAHLFQRMLHGLWSCVNSACPEKSEALSQWPFGEVYLTQRGRCRCGAPVYELGFCDSCKTPHLSAEDVKGFLRQGTPYAGDEFGLLEESEDEDEDDTQSLVGAAQQISVVLSPIQHECYQTLSLNLETAEIGGLGKTEMIDIHQASEPDSRCVACGNAGKKPAGFFKKAYLGAPFYVSNAIPTVLEFCPDLIPPKAANYSAETLPGRGRKILTFTDSRQGTARMAVRMQQEAERSKLRGLVFQILRNRQAQKMATYQADTPTGTYEELMEQADGLDAKGMKDLARQVRERAESARRSNVERPKACIQWTELVRELATFDDIKHSILDYNRYANPQLFSGHEGSISMARLLLMREYARRPKNQNSTETLGLVQVGYQGLEDIDALPDYWSETQVEAGNGHYSDPLDLDDWKDFLKVALDFYVRENTFLRLDETERFWMGARFAPKELHPPGRGISERRAKSWPQVGRGQQNRLVKLLALGAGLDLDLQSSKDKINYWLESAWKALIRANILQSHGNGYALSREFLTFALPQEAWICPVTHRLLDTTFRGLTPYLPPKADASQYRCTKVALPDFTELAPEGEVEGASQAIRKRIQENPTIRKLRADNLWTDISDRTAEGGFYYRTAEHSAQQSSDRLLKYEELFHKGKINVLNCSTTMEMGVDIGGVSAIVMNNVPPHPANYLQRTGRAGRRDESRSVAYTLCRPDPHNMRAFLNPRWPFETAIPAPIITLSATPLVQRHVNSFLLANFLKSETQSDDERTRLTVQWFFGGETPLSEQFAEWLMRAESESTHDEALRRIIKRTGLESVSFNVLASQCREAITQLASAWQKEEQRLIKLHAEASDEAYKKALELETKRHEQEYLLRDLAARAFLPGYGFPTDVVNLKTYNIEDFKERKKVKEQGVTSREDNVFAYKEQPSRGLPIAIREYAPGAQVVVDGRVYRSAGVSLYSYHNAAKEGAQTFDLAWRCINCGAIGYQEYAYSHSGDELSCQECNHQLHKTERKKILRPAGFITDFFEPTSNDVSVQKAIPVVKPRISVEENVVSLPDERCGFVRFGEKGHVLFHSGGENGHGYAVCMRCGRAESITANREMPDPLKPEQDHRPIGGASGSHKQKDCSGEQVMRDLYLGYQTQTNVLELALKNPRTGEWLRDSEKGRVIATTLAVALRDAIADQLGIAGTELGFGTRAEKDRESGTGRRVVQVYDDVSGGAGFVLSGLENLTGLLETVFDKLKCPADCDNVCSACLAGKDSRIENEELDRQGALEWVKESRFIDYLALPPPFDVIRGARYWPYEPLRFIRRWLDKDVSALTIIIEGEPESWELGDPIFRSRILGWKVADETEINLVLPTVDNLTDEQYEELAMLSRFGINVARSLESDAPLPAHRAIQMTRRDGGINTLMTNNGSSQVAGPSWLKGEETSLWVSMEEETPISFEAVDTSQWRAHPGGAIVLEITNELNGSVKGLGTRFRQLLNEKALSASTFARKLESDSVVSLAYEDRYLRSPWNVLLLVGFLSEFKSGDLGSVRVKAVFDRRPGSSSKLLFHNWPHPGDMEKALTTWLTSALGVTPDVSLLDRNQDLTHRRVLTIGLASGSAIKCVFDQGMGYWQLNAPAYDLRSFDFTASHDSQARQMLERWEKVYLVNAGMWPTDISIYEQ